MPRRFLRLLAAASVGDHVSDADLLRRYARDRDPAAFELLVRRHADAVWTACRRVLRSDADAEDAFQATFLVLARKAGGVRGACVGGWLYRVAVNAALKLRERTARLPSVGREDLTDVPAAPPADPDLAAAVQEEVARLPDRYRLPVVLCDLEGHTRAEAAAMLNWPVGSLSSRLSRARDVLRARLARRGLAPAAGAALVLPAGGLPAKGVSAAVAAATGVVPVRPSVSILAEGVLSAMRTAKLKLAAAVVAVTALLGSAGVGAFTALGQPPARPAEGDPGKTPAAPGREDLPTVTKTAGGVTAYPGLDPKSLEDLVTKCPKLFGGEDVPASPKDDALRQLQKARLNAAIAEFRALTDRLRAGTLTDARAIPGACDRATAAATDLFADPKELRPWAEERVRVMKWHEAVVVARSRQGTEPPGAEAAARYARLEAEVALLRLDRRVAGGGGKGP